MPGMAPTSWRRVGTVKLERQESTELKLSNMVEAPRIYKDLDFDLNVPYVEEEEESSSSSSTSAGREVQSRTSGTTDEAHHKSGGKLDDAIYRGVRHRPELNKWVTEIRPTAQKRKIWLGTYKTPEEAARAYDVGIYYTGKKIPLNFPDSVPNLPALPCGSWEEIAPFVKKQAVSAAKRTRADHTGRFLTHSIASRG